MTDKKKYPSELKYDDGRVVHYNPLVKIKCIYCKQMATLVEFSDESMGVLHEQPSCVEFNAMDVLSYVQENRKYYQKEVEDGKYRPN